MGGVALAASVRRYVTYGLRHGHAERVARRNESCGGAAEPRRGYRSPGCLAGLTETGIERSSAVRMMRVCSTVWAAG